ncbi:Dual specificity protein kinase [Balamuthia mandrillaris]
MEAQPDLAVWNTNEPHIKGKEVKLVSTIATGGYGTVYKGKCRGQTVAVKKLHNQALSGPKLLELKKEVEIMSQLRHPFVLMLMGVCTEENEVALVMEYVEGKSMEEILYDPQIELSWQQRFKLARDIAQGLDWLHSLDPPIIHGDIKPANVLVKTDFCISICDFGFSCIKEPHDPSAPPSAKVKGSPFWMSPELLRGFPPSEQSDIYAYAVVLWSIMTRTSPTIGVPYEETRQYMRDVVHKARRPPMPLDMFPSLRALIEEAWHQDHTKRPSFTEIRERLDAIFVEMMIEDVQGRTLWRGLREHVENRLIDHYPFKVSWETFVEEFYRDLNQPLIDPRHDHGYLCLNLMLAERYPDLTLASGELAWSISCENFGSFLRLFGPMAKRDSQGTIVDKFTNVCRQEWFHGKISVEDAETRLCNKQPGAFLVRLSSTGGNLTITTIDKHRRLFHQRIMRSSKNGKYELYITPDTKSSSDSLVELINTIAPELGLTNPCFDGRAFGPLFNVIESKGYVKATKPRRPTISTVQQLTSLFDSSSNGSNSNSNSNSMILRKDDDRKRSGIMPTVVVEEENGGKSPRDVALEQELEKHKSLIEIQKEEERKLSQELERQRELLRKKDEELEMIKRLLTQKTEGPMSEVEAEIQKYLSSSNLPVSPRNPSSSSAEKLLALSSSFSFGEHSAHVRSALRRYSSNEDNGHPVQRQQSAAEKND